MDFWDWILADTHQLQKLTATRKDVILNKRKTVTPQSQGITEFKNVGIPTSNASQKSPIRIVLLPHGNPSGTIGLGVLCQKVVSVEQLMDNIAIQCLPCRLREKVLFRETPALYFLT